MLYALNALQAIHICSACIVRTQVMQYFCNAGLRMLGQAHTAEVSARQPLRAQTCHAASIRPCADECKHIIMSVLRIFLEC